ncbi:MAG: hypothetical protein LBV40_07085 [Methanomicrobiales archaeon]|jgi:hypothetical protein|nr:hypothetical protein [Methanomicrobiales archaeon]
MLSSHELLKKHNPFISHSITHAEIWNPHYPDIASIHQDAFNRLISLVQKKQKNPTMAIAILVLGEGGIGKTQLLVRTVKYCSEDGKWGSSLVNCTPIQDAQPMKYLLQNIFTGLYEEFITRPGSSLFQRLLSAILRDCLLKRGFPLHKIHEGIHHFFAYNQKERGSIDILSEHVITWLKQQDITLDYTFLHILFQVCNPSRRTAAIRWLQGETLDQEYASLLNLSLDPKTKETREISESCAQTHLVTFGKLLARYHQILLVCFDQLEVWEGSEKHRKLGAIVQTILGHCPGMVPITFARTALWNEVIRKDLDPSLRDILSMNSITLYGCAKEQINALIKMRVQHALGDVSEMPYQWLIQKIDDKSLSSHPTPRDVILAANKIICEKISHPEEILHEKYASLCREIHGNIDSSLPTSDELVRALELYFSGIGVKCKRKQKSLITNTGLYITVNTEEKFQAVGKCFSDGSAYLSKNPDKVCIYLTDPRNSITKPTWKETNRKKEEFESQNGILYQPHSNEISRFYALPQLAAEIMQGNIRDEENKEITQGHLYQFINSKYFKPLLDIKRIHQERIIKEILFSSPEHRVSIFEITKRCADMGFPLSVEILQDICASRPDVYDIDKTSVQIKGYWRGVADAVCDVIDKTGYNFISVPDIIKMLHETNALIYPVSESDLMNACQTGDLKELFCVDQIKDGYMVRKR